MSDGLTTYRLGELCNLRAGAVFKPDLQGKSSGDFPFIKVSDMNLSANLTRIREANNWITEEERKGIKVKPFPPGTTVFAKIGEALKQNRLRLITQDTIIDNNMMGAIPQLDKVDADYFYYALSKFDFGAIAGGTALPYLTVGALSELQLDIPSLEAQHTIAHILGTLDDKIELNRRVNETLEAMARAIFKSWFVDFDPVRAKASGEPLESICRRLGLTPDVLALFPDSFQNSELGEIPVGWPVRSVGELCDRVAMGPFGSNIKTSNFVQMGVPIIRGGNLTNGFVDDRFVFLTEEKADQLRNSNARPGDIVITHRGTLGQVGLIPSDSLYPRYVVSQSQMVLSVRSAVLSSRHLYEFLRSPIGQQALLANTSQVGVPAIAQPTTSVKAIRITAPPVAVLCAYDSATGALFDQASSVGKQSSTLATLRDSLLPKLLSGESTFAKQGGV